MWDTERKRCGGRGREKRDEERGREREERYVREKMSRNEIGRRVRQLEEERAVEVCDTIWMENRAEEMEQERQRRMAPTVTCVIV